MRQALNMGVDSSFGQRCAVTRANSTLGKRRAQFAVPRITMTCMEKEFTLGVMAVVTQAGPLHFLCCFEL